MTEALHRLRLRAGIPVSRQECVVAMCLNAKGQTVAGTLTQCQAGAAGKALRVRARARVNTIPTSTIYPGASRSRFVLQFY